jgi:serine/threonine protein phosphatase PrpC
MGGSRRVVNGKEIGGEHAAAALGEVLEERLESLPPDLSVTAARELLSVAVAEGGESIYKEVNAGGEIPPEQIPAGKTAEDVMAAAVMTTLIFCENGRRATIGQNGDTRAYLYSDGDLILLTDDQDAVHMDLEEGKLTPEQADAVDDAADTFDGYDIGKLDPLARKYFMQRNLVFGQIGDEPDPQAPVFSTIQLQPGDMILMCSDGVYANLTTEEIRSTMASADPAAALADRADARSTQRSLPDPTDLSAPYNYRAHQDDTTAMVLRVEWS